MFPDPSPSARPAGRSPSGGPNVFRGRRHQWLVAPATPSVEMAPLGNLPPMVGHLLYRRGIRSLAEAQSFLGVSESDFEDPMLLPDMDAALSRLALARRHGERVAVYGDFDADGVTATALLVKALTRYGVDVVPYIPHRVTEGHGLNAGAIDTLRAQGVRLIVTVDCGVTDLECVSYAKGVGIDAIITDHHLTADNLPAAVAVINPHAPHSQYPFGHLTGVGMALKLAQALLQPVLGEDWHEGLLELAAIGTITDMAPLLGENRYIVSRGIQQLRGTSSAGLRALMRAARIEPARVDATGIGFGIGPRLNAAGRLDHADTAYELLMTTDPGRADALVAELDAINTLRQQLTEETLRRAREQVALRGPLAVAGSADFNPGVVGLVAGKLAEEFGRPALVFTEVDGRVVASCRSAPGFHWADALKACDELLVRHGGHAQAAGLTCEAGVFERFLDRLEAVATERVGDAVLAPHKTVDAEAGPHELMGPTFQALRRMEPFGMGNPTPLFLARGAAVERVSTMGVDNEHFRLTVRIGGALWEAVAFRQPWVSGTQRIDMVYALTVDEWDGRPRLRLGIEDFAPTA